MGIGNTTTSSAVLAALTGAGIEDVTGRGGGLTDAAFLKKKEVISHALALHKPDSNDPIDVLSKVGGFDLCAMTGVFLGAAQQRLPVVVDGFISIVAALCAGRLAPRSKGYFLGSHRSFEVGFRLAERELGLKPCLDLGMRLGEGSGCPLGFRVVEAACCRHGRDGDVPRGRADRRRLYLRRNPRKGLLYGMTCFLIRRLEERQIDAGAAHRARAVPGRATVLSRDADRPT